MTDNEFFHRVIVDLMPILVDHREFVKSSYTLIPKMLELNDAVVFAVRVSLLSYFRCQFSVRRRVRAWFARKIRTK